jgi:hypothetical protein
MMGEKITEQVRVLQVRQGLDPVKLTFVAERELDGNRNPVGAADGHVECERAVGFRDRDGLRQPLIDASDVSRIGRQRMEPGERRRDHPAVVGRVHAAGDQRGASTDGEAAKVCHDSREWRPGVTLHHRAGWAPRLEHERRIGWRMEIRRVEIDGAVAVLHLEQEADSELERLYQCGGVEEAGARRA